MSINETETTVEAAPVESTEISEPKKTYAPWVGVVMAWLIPGSPHFLTGRRWVGIAWFFGLILGAVLSIAMMAVPGAVWVWLGILGFTVYGIALIKMLVSSYRPVNRLGWCGWIVFLLLWWFVVSNVGHWFIQYIGKPYLLETFVMSSMPMAPTLQAPSEVVPGAPEIPDRITVNKMIYRFYEPKRGDIVAYRTTTTEGKPTAWCHRLVGLPGETVDIESPYALIDGKRVTDPPIFETMAEKRNGYSGYVSLQEIGIYKEDRDVRLPVTLGPDEYFVMGDNSEWSRDSRMRGPIKRSDILGKAVRIYWPPDRFGDLK